MSSSLKKDFIQIRNEVNNTFQSRKGQLIHKRFFEIAKSSPNNVALLEVDDSSEKVLTYSQLAEKSLKLASYLKSVGVKTGDYVSLSLPRGINQIVAIMGILSAGATYVPVGIKQPLSRYEKVCNIANIRYLLTDMQNAEKYQELKDVSVLTIENLEEYQPIDFCDTQDVTSSAYIIFTSGTSGEPKGVEISHDSAYNTIDDIINRYNINSNDRFISVSALDFDLSVFDVFGSLSSGASLFVLNEDNSRETSKWLKYLQEYNITVWNSVPALFEMLLISAKDKLDNSKLRLVLLSGDWVPVKLYSKLKEHIKGFTFVSLGGATEASIWSNYYELSDKDLNNKYAYYGKPLSNQEFRIVDANGQDCKENQEGELIIGGRGVAKGYVGNPQLTDKSFYVQDDKRWYKTGDMGRYLSDGNIEFLGRKDTQVKVNGYRIELGEIEKVLEKYPSVERAVAFINQVGSSNYIVSAVTEKQSFKFDFNERTVEKYSYDKDNNIEYIFVVYYLLEILGLNNSKVGDVYNIHDISSKFLDKFEPVIIYWLYWLSKCDVLTIDGDNVILKDTSFSTSKKDEFIGNKFYSNVQLAMDILKGEKSELVFIEDKENLLEKNALNETGVVKAIQNIADEINSKENPKVAIYGVSSGVLAGNLISKLNGADVTLFDKDRFKLNITLENPEVSSKCNKSVLVKKSIDDNLRFNFDYVVILNTLHSELNADAEVKTIADLLNSDGKVMVLDLNSLPPFALLNSAIIELGFTKFVPPYRPERFNPMLTSNEWSKVFSKVGYQDVSYINFDGSNAFLLTASNFTGIHGLSESSLLEFAKKNLVEYMVPQKILKLENFVLTGNGKVDVKYLKNLVNTELDDEKQEPPVTDMEVNISKMWKDILNVDVYRNSNFFKIGGDSLLATHFLTQLEEKMSITVSLKELFETSKLQDFCELLEQKSFEMEDIEEGEL